MAEITAAAVKHLRETSGAGMMDCKKALMETNGDMEAAVDWLRKKGIMTAGKKSGRVAAEGLIAVAASEDGKEAAMIELNSETDFVAKNADFQQEALRIAKITLAKTSGELTEVLAANCNTLKIPVSEIITNLVAKIGENINLRKTTKLKVTNGLVSTYIHNAVAPNAGKIGVLVALESTAPRDKLEQIGKQIAMHVAAAKPELLHRAELAESRIQNERELSKDKAAAFEKKFQGLKQRLESAKEKMADKERSFSEKQFEAKLEELDQISHNWETLNYEDPKSKKIIDTFLQEANYLLKKVSSYGDKDAIIKKYQDFAASKFVEDTVLSEQIYVLDNKTKLSDVLQQASKKSGTEIKIAGFKLYVLGEGIEKEQKDFAAEVAEAAKAAG